MNSQLKEWVKNNGSALTEERTFTIYELEGNVKHEDLENKVRVVTVGPENDLETKALLLLGETGVGKTTFLNTFLNMVFGVGLEDELRLQLKDQMDQAKDSTQSQTEYTTAFTIYHQEGMPQPFNYMVIDTPGLGDTEGDQKDKVNEKCLRFYLTNEAWIKHLNCVGLVWKASSRRLDEHNQAVLSKINSLLGFDIKPITDVLFTFSGAEDPDVVQVIEAAGIDYKKAFHFENMPLYKCPAQGMDALHALTWEAMAYNHSKFLNELNQRQPQELRITARLLLEQAKLEEVQVRVSALEESSALTSDQLQSHQAKMSDLEAMAAKVDWDKIEKLDTSHEEIVLDDGRHCHFCNLCQRVCVQVCTDDHQSAMDHSDTDTCAEEQGLEESFVMVQDAVEAVDMYMGDIAQTYHPSSTHNNIVENIIAKLKRIVVVIGGVIMGFLKYVKSEEETQTLHLNEGSQRCPVCQHMVLKHEIRNKILAKDANFEQKMELIKKKKYLEVVSKKNLLQAEIEAVQAEQDKFEKLKEEELKVLEEMQMKVKRLQTGQLIG
ncbi:uncharacterized protein LOC119580378 [Penaeus monodon]|uniref:uncharacterized protein LOC119580378 n=1 Tax=Penaeus monodon TaxID=6687 RepID=UPI0018A79FD0|nr:uncharacterized protein LOC119580378 [Penaeus monodon]